MIKPDVLILDEPTAGQDFAHYTEFMDFLSDLNTRGTTVILITHDMHVALEYTSRVVAMADGKIIADDAPAHVLTDSDIARKADIVTTGLYGLSQLVGYDDASALAQAFVNVDRIARRRMPHPHDTAETGGTARG